jgi:hypothetical protein
MILNITTMAFTPMKCFTLVIGLNVKLPSWSNVMGKAGINIPCSEDGQTRF